MLALMASNFRRKMHHQYCITADTPTWRIGASTQQTSVMEESLNPRNSSRIFYKVHHIRISNQTIILLFSYHIIFQNLYMYTRSFYAWLNRTYIPTKKKMTVHKKKSIYLIHSRHDEWCIKKLSSAAFFTIFLLFFCCTFFLHFFLID